MGLSETGTEQDVNTTVSSLVCLRGAGLGLCAFASGGAVMVYEFLAVRILQRYYGSSLDVWASEIAVCLAGIAVGCALGGIAADRYRSTKPLALALILAGATGFYIEPLALWIGERLLQVDAGLSWHPLMAASISSFLPFVFLGSIMPQTIRLQVRNVERVGTAAGWLSTISTAGGIAGALVTAHLLIPRHGVRESIMSLSLTLIILGWLVLTPLIWARIRGFRRVALVLALSMAMACPASAVIIYEDYSAYHHILVEDIGSQRRLRFDDAIQSTALKSNLLHGGFEYTNFFHLPMALDPAINKVLFIGLGGGTGPKEFVALYPNVYVDVAEIDPMVERIARAFFAVPHDPRLRVVIEDGRRFLRRVKGRYGAIVVDAYGSGRYGAYLPYHLATQEFFRIAWGKMETGGCLVYNVMGAWGGTNDDIIRNMMTTLRTVFQAVYAFRALSSENTVFVAMKINPRELAPDGTKGGHGWPAGPWLQHPVAPAQLAELIRSLHGHGLPTFPQLERRVVQTSPVQNIQYPGQLLTDNYAPVDTGYGRR